jgi:hypothetical protein
MTEMNTHVSLRKILTEAALKWRVSFLAWLISSSFAAAAISLGCDGRIILWLLLLTLPVFFLLFSPRRKIASYSSAATNYPVLVLPAWPTSMRPTIRVAIAVLLILALPLAYDVYAYSQYVRLPEMFEGEISNKAFSDVRVVPAGPDLKIEAEQQLLISNQYEDLGRYRIDAMSQSIASFLRDVLQDAQGATVTVTIIGTTDSMPVSPAWLYPGDLGRIENTPYTQYDERTLRHINLIPGETPITNESLAFLRAYALYRHLIALEAPADSRISIATPAILVSDLQGPEARRVIVLLTFKNGLKREYERLGPVGKSLVDARRLNRGRSDLVPPEAR